MSRLWPLATALLLASCAPNGPLGSDTTGTAPEDLEGAWVLSGGQSPDGNDPLKAGGSPAMRITEDGVGGTAACNDYHYEEWEFDGANFSVAEPMWTGVLCEDDYMDAEIAFKDALEASEEAELTDDQLRLMGGGGHLIFDKADQVENGPGSSDDTRVAETIQDVDYYYACGNEVLQLPDGRRFYPFPDQDAVDEDAYLSAPTPRPRQAQLAAAVLAVPAPEPGDDTGTLTIYKDNTARFVSESGTEAWLTDEEQTYNWEC